jgi:hypothetical protein
VTRAADEPQYAAPLSDRLGYLRHMIADVELASPDTLHGAAHLAPLTGIEFPMLQILADLNDAAIEAGAAADLDELARLRQLTTARLHAESDRITTADPADGGAHEQIVARLRAYGEVLTAEVLLVGAPDRFAALAMARLRDIDVATMSAREGDLVSLVAAHLEADDLGAALVVLRSLVEEFGARPLDGA